MKKILFLLSIAMLAVGCNPSDTPTGKEPTSKYKKYAGDTELKIMSFNIRTKTDNDKGINHWDNRKAACIELIRDHKPTIMGVQEAQYNSQWTYLKDQLKVDGYDGYGVNRSNGEESGNGEVVGIFWNTDVVKKIEVGTFWLSETPNEPSISWGMSMKRTATWGLFEHIPTGKKFFYLNTHLPLANDKLDDPELAKKEGMKLIAKKLKEYEKKYSIYLTGDFNVLATDEPMDAIKDFMRNARMYAYPTDSYGTTNNNFTSNASKKTIDHIYYRKDLKAEEYYTIRDPYLGVTYVSDHYPIYAIVTIK